MQVNVRVSGVLAQQIGKARFPAPLPEKATVQQLLHHLKAQHPQLAAELDQVVVVIGGVHQAPTALLENGQEVALLLPIAGG